MPNKRKAKEDRLAQQRLCKRRRYAEVINDPELLALEKEKRRIKYLKRKESKKVKSIKEETPRAQREKRKKWKENSKRYRLRKKEQLNNNNKIPEPVRIEATHSELEDDNLVMQLEDPLHHDCPTVRVAVRRIRYTELRKRKRLMSIIGGLKKKVESQHKRIIRLQRKIEHIHEGMANSEPRVCQIASTSQTPCLTNLNKSTSKSRRSKVIETVINFYNEDENSTLRAGKKEYITRNKTRMQKRHLNAPLKDLHKKFKLQTKMRISYSLFCKLRPFWVVFPKAADRETCLCSIHLNIDLLIESLNKASIINEKNHREVLSKICCDRYNIDCLRRKNCTNCATRHLEYKEFKNDRQLIFHEWKKVRKDITSKDGSKKKQLLTVKEKSTLNPTDLIAKFERELPKFLDHTFKLVSQYNSIKNLKENLNILEACVHVDFSENYACKYAKEVQSFHFGGSRQQLTLHTAVIYSHNWTTGKVTPTSFCTISDCNRHDAPAIWAHIVPLIEEALKLNPFIDTIHFISDSPTSQYRNKYLFYFISQINTDFHQISKVTWNYSEAGHGKGAPDGVGATLKRTADRLINFGEDIENFEKFYELLSSATENITIRKVTEEDVLRKESLIPDNLRTFKGTLKVYQVLWVKNSKVTTLRKMSCFLCDFTEVCTHGYHLGFIDNKPVTQKENVDPDAVIMLAQTKSTTNKKTQSKPIILSNVLIKPTNKN